MTEYIEIIVGLITIVTFLCAIVNYTIIKPQRFVVSELKRVVENLDAVVTDIRNRVIAGEVKIEKLEERFEAVENYLINQPPMMGVRRKNHD